MISLHMRASVLCATVLASFISFSAPAAYAQSAIDVPGPADVGQTERSVPQVDFGGVAAPQIDIPEVRVDGAPDGADQITFTLNSINLEGITAYNIDELSPIWNAELGTTITLTEVYAIAQQITRKYRNDGYIITQAIIPQQTIDGGNVTIRVVEGFIANVSLQDADDSIASEKVLRLARNLEKETPLTAEALERWLLLVNDIPGLSARSIIRPSETTVGGADLIIIPTIDPFNASVTLDNYGSRYIGPLQLSVAGQLNNILGLADTLQAQFVSDPDDDERLYAFTRYSLPVNRYGTTVGVDFTYSDTNPGFELDIFDVNGESKLYGIDVTHPIIRTRTQNLFSSLRFDYRDLTSDNIVDTFTTEDHIAALRLGLDYNLYDTWWKPAVNEAMLTISQGIDVFDASDKGDANMTRANGDPQFTKAELSLSRLQTLSPSFSLLTGMTGQISNNPLLSSEEIGFGGRTFGRGYDASEIVGDDGFGASLELIWNPAYNMNIVDDYEIFTFYDFGKIWNQETDVDALEHRSIASTGLGIRADVIKGVNAEMIFAYPLTKEVDAYDSADSKFLFSLGAEF